MRVSYALAGLLLAAAASVAVADLDGSYVLPADHEAIRYASSEANDTVAALQARLKEGKLVLKYNADLGYLPAVLEALHITPSSQVLVFSKTSFQAPRIAPRTPRALYFNDQVTVGYVKGGDVLELAAADPQLGVVFYTMDQERQTAPRFDRQDQCLQCHASGATLGVPGMLVRSVVPDRTGMPIFHAGTHLTDHRSPLSERWGGWYVSGTHGKQRHMGNVFSADKEAADLDPTAGQNVTDLSRFFDTGAYLTPHSDIVALMVLEHQSRLQNTLTRVGYETRMALYQQAAMNKALGEPADHIDESMSKRLDRLAAEVVRTLLFKDETRLTSEVKGISGFAEAFSKAGKRDSKGRSLRDFDLQTRLFRYPCSYLIDSPAFSALPELVRSRVQQQLLTVLSRKTADDEFPQLAPADRQNLWEILTETHPGWAQQVASR